MAGVPLETIFFALLGGIIPTAMWLWFWMSEDSEKPEPLGLITLTYIAGAASVFLALPLQRFFQAMALGDVTRITVFALIEEFVKVAFVAMVAFKARSIDEPTDYTVYLVTGALGFSAIENTLYLIQPLLDRNIAFFLLAGNLRFLGSTVLHTISVALVGLLMGIGYYRTRERRLTLAVIGFFLGTSLHTIFNYLIMIDTRQSTLLVFTGLWVVALVMLVLFGQLRAFGRLYESHYDTKTLPL
jgi:RsiW-degrading membrane proteinase PrsW (M82 family)